MNISNAYKHYVLPLLSEIHVPILTDQQKRIVLIISSALSFLGACYFIRRCCFKAKLAEEKQTDKKVAVSFVSPSVSLVSVSQTPDKRRKTNDSFQTPKRNNTLTTDFDSLPKDLKEINLRASSITDAQISLLPKNIENLCLARCNQLTDQAIIQLSETYKQLEVLNLTDCQSLTPASLEHLPLLKKLVLTGWTSLTDEVIKKFPQTLIVIRLSGCISLTNQAIQDLPRGLLHLTLSRISNLTDEVIGWLPPNLEELNVDYCAKITGKTFDALPQTLTKLEARGCFLLSDDKLEKLPENIEELNFEGCTGLTSAVFESLSKLKKLKKLNIIGCPKLSDEKLAQFTENNTHVQIIKTKDKSFFSPRR